MELKPLLVRKPSERWQKKMERDARPRRLMRTRVAPDEAGKVYTLGYSYATGRTCTGSIPKYSGSSLNRKNDKGTIEKSTAAVRATARAKVGFPSLFTDEEVQRKIAGDRLANAHERENRIHVLAPRSRGKIRDKFNAFFTACKRKAVFATLSFIEAIEDTAAMKILNKFLTSLRKRFADLQYIWVAERQNDNQKFPGNIHFHVMLNKYLPVAEYNALWTLQQYNSGLKGYSKKLCRHIELHEIHAMIFQEELQQYLNPFDVKRVYSVDRLAGYLTTYITKNKDAFACASWHCSRGVSRMFTKKAIQLSLFQAVADPEINYTCDKDTGEVFTGKIFTVKNCPFVVIGYILNKKYFGDHMRDLEAINRWILFEKFMPDIPMLTDAEYLNQIHNEQLN